MEFSVNLSDLKYYPKHHPAHLVSLQAFLSHDQNYKRDMLINKIRSMFNRDTAIFDKKNETKNFQFHLKPRYIF